MAVRHIKEYYEKVSNQYFESLKMIENLEKEVMLGMVDPEFLDRVKNNVQPIKDNYQYWCWVMYLLNQPNRNNKVKKYKEMNKRLINKLDTKNSPDERFRNCEKAKEKLSKDQMFKK